MLDELEWPSLEDRRVKSSLTFFYKIHSGTVSLDKDILNDTSNATDRIFAIISKLLKILK